MPNPANEIPLPFPHEDRFWSRVKRGEPNECWEFQGGESAYGRFAWNRQETTAHRIAWTLKNGQITEGLIVRHQCDNRRCCNPSHLELGTPQENTADMISRGRAGWMSTRPGDSPARKRSTKPKLTTHERFWAKVDKSGGDEACWLWLGSKGQGGHGTFREGSQVTIVAHRFSFREAWGILPDNLCVCHDCPGGDNPSCVNPKHLWLGTKGDNIRDSVNKGTRNMAKGDRNGSRLHPERLKRGDESTAGKLNRVQVEEILSLYVQGWKQRELAKRFGVVHSAIGAIVQGKTWLEVPRPPGMDTRIVPRPTKIPPEEWPKIRQLSESGRSGRGIAKEYGVNPHAIGRIVKSLNITECYQLPG